MQNAIPTSKKSYSCENYLPYDSMDMIDKYLGIADSLRIPLLIIDNLTIKQRDLLLESEDFKNYSLQSPKQIYDEVRVGAITHEELKTAFEELLQSNPQSKILFVSRKTIHESSIDKIKKQLGSIRNQYEIIALFAKNKNALKWAAQDRRIDYVSINILENSEFLDKALCSVIKQNNKKIEVILSSLLKIDDERELSEVLRKGKKLMNLITSTNTPFIFTMNPNSHLELRTGSQMRLLGNLLGVDYNKTRSCVFEKQLQVIIDNTLKLHDSFAFEGIKEV